MEAFTEKRFLKPMEIDLDAKNKIISVIRDILFSIDPILFAYIHGSFIKSPSFRDIDIAVFMEDKTDFFFESDLSFRLTSALGLPVELKAINEAPVPFQMAVIRDGVLLFCRDEIRRADFIESVGKRYREYAHFRNIFLGIDGVRQG
jgi:predicted nucleotidyltransferase